MERKSMKCCGRSFKLTINVGKAGDTQRKKADCNWIGSRYIYDLYYEKQAISKQLYDWLLKNNYADANLIAKWKKQGYEKVCRRICAGSIHSFIHSLTSLGSSSVVFVVFKPKRPTSTQRVYAEFPRRNSRTSKWSSVSAVVAEDAPAVTRTRWKQVYAFWTPAKGYPLLLGGINRTYCYCCIATVHAPSLRNSLREPWDSTYYSRHVSRTCTAGPLE